MTHYTIEVYKTDKRFKSGKRYFGERLLEAENFEAAEEVAKEMVSKNPKMTYEVHQTYRDVRNIMTGEIVQEHYKTPYSCSVGSESYFCS